MRPEILALFIPILTLVGLFTVIALNILFKYKAKELTANRAESIDEIYKAEAQLKLAKVERRTTRNRGLGLRLCGLLAGVGVGVAIGCTILACGGVPRDTGFDRDAIATFMIIALAMICGGAGMIGAYFLEKKLE